MNKGETQSKFDNINIWQMKLFFWCFFNLPMENLFKKSRIVIITQTQHPWHDEPKQATLSFFPLSPKATLGDSRWVRPMGRPRRGVLSLVGGACWLPPPYIVDVGSGARGHLFIGPSFSRGKGVLIFLIWVTCLPLTFAVCGWKLSMS